MDVSEGGRRCCTHGERDLLAERYPIDYQRQLSGAHGVLSACESTLVVIRSGRVAQRAGWQEGGARLASSRSAERPLA